MGVVGARRRGVGGHGPGIVAYLERTQNAKRALEVTGWIVGSAALAFGAVVLAMCAFFHIGYVSRDDWPGELREMVEVGGGDAGKVSAQCLGGFIDSQYVWRVPVAGGQAVRRHGTLRPVPHSGQRHAGVVSEALSDLVAAATQGFGPEFFSTPDFPFDNRGCDGLHMLAMHDRWTSMLYVYCKENF